MRSDSQLRTRNSRRGRNRNPAVFLSFGFGLLVVGSLASGCAKATAQTVPDGPPLATPAPPPRDHGPVEDLAAAPIGAASPDAPAAAGPRTAPAPPRTPARREDSKPEPAAAPPTAAAPAEPPRELRAVPSAAAAAEERKIRDVLSRAANDLKRVDPAKLSAERKSQYEQSRRFAEQAEQAIKERNYPLAATLADKARQLAEELAALR